MANFRRFAIFLLGIAPALANIFPLEPAPNAKKAYVSNLLRNAKPVERKLEDAEGEYESDITGYYLQFQKCALNTQIGACGDDGDSVCIESKKLVVFRLCKDCSSCNYDYAEYLVDLETYAAATTEYFQRVREEECKDCEEACQNDENEGDEGDRRLDDCSCMDDCEAYENMEENGYIDASDYLAECQQIGEENDDGSRYYVGPACSNDGTEISISVYSDENCEYPADVEPSDLLGQDNGGEGEDEGEANNIQLNYDTLDMINNDICISCLQEKEEEENDNEDEDEAEEEEKETAEICEQLYEAAAKCESNNGFDAGYNYYDINYDQASQEESVCDMITQLTTTYSSGSEESSSSSSEVNRSKAAAASTSTTTKFVLGALVLLSVGLAAWAWSLHSQLKNNKPDFSYEGEAMTT